MNGILQMVGWLAATAIMILVIPLELAGQQGVCEDGPRRTVLIGLPLERVVVASEGPSQEPLQDDEAREYQVEIACGDGVLLWASRENHPLHLIESGWYLVFLDVLGGGEINLRISWGDVCDELIGESQFEYSEIVRQGIHQIIYRGRIVFPEGTGLSN